MKELRDGDPIELNWIIKDGQEQKDLDVIPTVDISYIDNTGTEISIVSGASMVRESLGRYYLEISYSGAFPNNKNLLVKKSGVYLGESIYAYEELMYRDDDGTLDEPIAVFN